MADLETNYLGLKLKNPLVASSCPLTYNVDSVVRLERAGVAAIVMRSIFEESIEAAASDMVDALLDDTSMTAMEYLLADLPGQLASERYIDRLKELRERVDIPIVASVNCVRAASWVEYAMKLERAGADALELNLYHMPVDPREGSEAVERRRLTLVKAVAGEVKVPVVVKLSKHYTSLLSFVRELDTANVGGVVLFNRFLQTNVDHERESIYYAPDYSTSKVLHSQLRWTAIIRDWFRGSIAISGGIHEGADLAKSLLVGADVGCICSALYKSNDYGVVGRILEELAGWMDRKGYATPQAFRGRLRESNLNNGSGFERMQYVRASTKV